MYVGDVQAVIVKSFIVRSVSKEFVNSRLKAFKFVRVMDTNNGENKHSVEPKYPRTHLQWLFDSSALFTQAVH